MSSETSYGGWITDRPAATGDTSSLIRMVGRVAVAGLAVTAIGTGGHLSVQHLQRGAQQALYAASTPDADIVTVAHVRSPSEDLARIREVIRPAVSDLAAVLGVSRQSVYNWLNGEPVAEENAARLRGLAQAADVLAHAGVVVDAALLKRKFANGRTLMQVAQAGDSVRDAALILVQIHRREAAQRERMAARFANRARTPATADFDLPASNDEA
jgi:transcriptional regulator with XRE-family HTH domain